MSEVVLHVLWRRRLGLVWWALGVLAADGLLAIAYPTVRDNSELDSTFAGLPPGVQAALGLQAGAITSPAGYLNSQFFANLLPIILLVFAIGWAAWSIAGDEAAGTLELLLANPVTRMQVMWGRAVALLLGLATLTLVAAAGLAVLAPLTGLGSIGPLRILEAAAGTGLLALVYACLAMAVGAGFATRSGAIAVAAGIAVAQFMVEGLAEQVKLLRPIREASPWHWFLGTDPIRHGLLWQSWVLPLVVSLALLLVGSFVFRRRSLHCTLRLPRLFSPSPVRGPRRERPDVVELCVQPDPYVRTLDGRPHLEDATPPLGHRHRQSLKQG